MKWTRAVHHLETLAQTCTDLGSRPAFSGLRVEQLWVAREILDEPHDLELVTVALVVDRPGGGGALAGRAARRPALGQRRPAGQEPGRGPVAVGRRAGVEPLTSTGPRCSGTAPTAWSRRRSPRLRPAAATPSASPRRSPPSCAAGCRTSWRSATGALRACTQTYERRRWAPGALEPHADALWRASAGYLEVRDALAALDRLTAGAPRSARLTVRHWSLSARVPARCTWVREDPWNGSRPHAPRDSGDDLSRCSPPCPSCSASCHHRTPGAVRDRLRVTTSPGRSAPSPPAASACRCRRRRRRSSSSA